MFVGLSFLSPDFRVLSLFYQCGKTLCAYVCVCHENASENFRILCSDIKTFHCNCFSFAMSFIRMGCDKWVLSGNTFTICILFLPDIINRKEEKKQTILLFESGCVHVCGLLKWIFRKLKLKSILIAVLQKCYTCTQSYFRNEM